MSYDHRPKQAANQPKRAWKQEGPKKWIFYDDRAWEGRLTKNKPTDTEWVAQYSINGSTWNAIRPEERFADPEEGKLAVEAYILTLIKEQLAKYE